MKKRIEKLTKKQKAAMPEWAEKKWITVGLNTAPLDREKAAAAARRCMRAAGKRDDVPVMFAKNPIDGAIAFSLGAAAIDGRDMSHADVAKTVQAILDNPQRAVANVPEAKSLLRDGWHRYLGGQFWAGGWYWGGAAYVSFFQDVCGLELPPDIEERARANQDATRELCWWWPHERFVVACERPHTISRDEAGRLHSTTGAACAWDGWGVYSVHGVRVPGDIIEKPETLTVERIGQEQNAEVRRVMVELYGLARYVRDAQFEVLDMSLDPLGQPRRLLREGDVLVVELVNSTVDVDGTRRVYHVACHPELRPLLPDGSLGEPQKLTALNAVASTYGLTGPEYAPEVET